MGRPADCLPPWNMHWLGLFTRDEINHEEIAEVFSVPLLAFADYRIVEDQLVKIDGVERMIRVYHVGKRQVWGLTARIIQNLMTRLGFEIPEETE